MAVYDQPTNRPTNKMTAVGVSGAIAIVLLYALEQSFGIIFPTEVASSITVIVSLIAGYVIRDSTE